MPVTIPSVSQIAKMVGGGGGGGGGGESKKDLTVGSDFIALALLFVLAASGFALSAVRGRNNA